MRRLFRLGFLFATVASWAHQVPGVTSDFEKAQFLSRVYEKPLVLVFTGSDWSASSSRFIENVLKESDLANAFLVVNIDFPEINAQSLDRIEQNQALKERFEVNTFPTIVLTDLEGNEVTRFGYLGEDAAEFADELSEKWSAFVHLRRELEQGDLDNDQLERLYVRAVDLGAKTLASDILGKGGDSRLLMEKYVTLVNRGLIKSQEAIAIRGSLEKSDDQLQADILEFQKNAAVNFDLAANNLARSLEKYCDQENIWKLQLMLSDQFYDEEKWDEALYYAECAFKHAPGSKRRDIEAKIASIKLHMVPESSNSTP